MRVSGVPTTVPFHERLLSEPAFIAGDVHTRFVRETMWAGHPMQGML
jgi:acetyl-CoA carboxylase biotin carboxylase subunit